MSWFREVLVGCLFLCIFSATIGIGMGSVTKQTQGTTKPVERESSPRSGSEKLRFPGFRSSNYSPARYRYARALDFTQMNLLKPSAVTLNSYGYAPEAVRYFWFNNPMMTVRAPSVVPRRRLLADRTISIPVTSSSPDLNIRDHVHVHVHDYEQTPMENVEAGQVSIPIPFPVEKSMLNPNIFYRTGTSGSVSDPWYPYMTTAVSTQNPYYDLHGSNVGYLADYPYYHGMYNTNQGPYHANKYQYQVEPQSAGHQYYGQNQNQGQYNLMNLEQQLLQHEMEHPEHFHHIP